MKSHETAESFWDMDRLARVFTWLAGALMIFVLGMVFMNAIYADSMTSSSTTTSTTAQ